MLDARRHLVRLPAWQVWVHDLGAWQRWSITRWRLDALRVGFALVQHGFRVRFTRTWY